MRQSILMLFLVSILFLSACASDSSMNPFAESAPAPTTPYYFDEFVDVPIPHDMREVNEETMVTYAPSGVKIGNQRFKGRVDANSLLTTMRKNMTGQGWNLHSLFRAQRSIIIYEKPDRVCTINIVDDTIYTNMYIFVTPKLSGDLVEYDSPVLDSAPLYDSGSGSGSGSQYDSSTQPINGAYE